MTTRFPTGRSTWRHSRRPSSGSGHCFKAQQATTRSWGESPDYFDYVMLANARCAARRQSPTAARWAGTCYLRTWRRAIHRRRASISLGPKYPCWRQRPVTACIRSRSWTSCRSTTLSSWSSRRARWRSTYRIATWRESGGCGSGIAPRKPGRQRQPRWPPRSWHRRPQPHISPGIKLIMMGTRVTRDSVLELRRNIRERRLSPDGQEEALVTPGVDGVDMSTPTTGSGARCSALWVPS